MACPVGGKLGKKRRIFYLSAFAQDIGDDFVRAYFLESLIEVLGVVLMAVVPVEWRKQITLAAISVYYGHGLRFHFNIVSPSCFGASVEDVAVVGDMCEVEQVADVDADEIEDEHEDVAVLLLPWLHGIVSERDELFGGEGAVSCALLAYLELSERVGGCLIVIYCPVEYSADVAQLDGQAVYSHCLEKVCLEAPEPFGRDGVKCGALVECPYFFLGDEIEGACGWCLACLSVFCHVIRKCALRFWFSFNDGPYLFFQLVERPWAVFMREQQLVNLCASIVDDCSFQACVFFRARECTP